MLLAFQIIQIIAFQIDYNNIYLYYFSLKQCRTIEIDGEIPDDPFLSGSQDSKQPSALSVLAFWDDLCIYGNALIDALNELRSGLSPSQVTRHIFFNSKNF